MRYICASRLTLEDFDDPAAQEKFAAAIFKPHWAKKTIATHLLRFCAFGNWLALQNFTQTRHRPLRKLSRRPQIREIPTDDEVKKLLNSLRERASGCLTPNRKRAYEKDYLMTRLLCETGIRIGEAVRFERQDLITHGDHAALFVRGTKSEGSERAVIISTFLRDELAAFCKRWQVDKFTSRTGKRLEERSFGTWLSDYCENLKLSCHISPHTFRYKFILDMIASGKSALEVMSRAGHTDIEMTVYYFNQVRRLMPWIEVNGDVALLEKRRSFWQGKNERRDGGAK